MKIILDKINIFIEKNLILKLLSYILGGLALISGAFLGVKEMYSHINSPKDLSIDYINIESDDSCVFNGYFKIAVSNNIDKELEIKQIEFHVLQAEYLGQDYFKQNEFKDICPNIIEVRVDPVKGSVKRINFNKILESKSIGHIRVKIDSEQNYFLRIQIKFLDANEKRFNYDKDICLIINTEGMVMISKQWRDYLLNIKGNKKLIVASSIDQYVKSFEDIENLEKSHSL